MSPDQTGGRIYGLEAGDTVFITIFQLWGDEHLLSEARGEDDEPGSYIVKARITHLVDHFSAVLEILTRSGEEASSQPPIRRNYEQMTPFPILAGRLYLDRSVTPDRLAAAGLFNNWIRVTIERAVPGSDPERRTQFAEYGADDAEQIADELAALPDTISVQINGHEMYRALAALPLDAVVLDAPRELVDLLQKQRTADPKNGDPDVDAVIATLMRHLRLAGIAGRALLDLTPAQRSAAAAADARHELRVEKPAIGEDDQA